MQAHWYIPPDLSFFPPFPQGTRDKRFSMCDFLMAFSLICFFATSGAHTCSLAISRQKMCIAIELRFAPPPHVFKGDRHLYVLYIRPFCALKILLFNVHHSYSGCNSHDLRRDCLERSSRALLSSTRRPFLSSRLFVLALLHALRKLVPRSRRVVVKV